MFKKLAGKPGLKWRAGVLPPSLYSVAIETTDLNQMASKRKEGTMKKHFACFIAIVGLVMLFGQVSFACTCIAQTEDQTLREKVESAKDSATAVFTGKVLEITKISDTQNYVRFQVDLNWKGVNESEVSLLTGSQGGADCGYVFETGRDYLVYAFEFENGELGTNICQRTNMESESEEEIKILNEISGP